MKKIKIMTSVLLIILAMLIVPVKVSAAEADMQIVKTQNNDYIIYVKDLANTEFKFAISTEKDDEDVNYINSVTDGEGNQVALIKKEKVSEGKNYIYIKTEEETKINEVDFSQDTQIFDIEKMQQVEKTTKRIETELLTNLEKRNENVNGIQYTETVGGLKIIDNEKNATYFYERIKLPKEEYSRLKELADELNSKYEEKDMFAKIEFSKEFYNLEQNLISKAQWESVENNEIRQPIEAQKGDEYIVLLKKVAQSETRTAETTETYDVKFMVSYREDEEEKIPGRTETRVVRETAKLPITGDNIILFVVLAVIIVAIIFVFVRMKKLQSKESKH